ncbi:CidA/LrgA family protein [Peptoniphilus equinus]|uniref:CidA/LrgA family protein n=1 Tax=Peptoniphilus equinus TaxID=3016343 RepID=A0ABY7QS50_9FIRM|nr:CidA/LrgA family protein [Peptoniphilus equinus]WBW49587.1 CidA/LrgA family protein [Peptoniphilus equinus]
MIQQFFVLTVCLFMGHMVNVVLSTPIPMVVWGMLFLFSALYFKILPVDEVEQASSGLLKYFAFYFLPAGVEIMNEYHTMDGKVVHIVVLLILSTVITLSVTALVVDRVIRRLS